MKLSVEKLISDYFLQRDTKKSSFEVYCEQRSSGRFTQGAEETKGELTKLSSVLCLDVIL